MGSPANHLIKVNINSNVNKANFEVQANTRDNETNWMLMKKMIVNELFGIKLNLGFLIQGAGISELYSLIMSKRGVDEEAITNASLSEKILWFLNELSEVKPDPSVITLYVDLYPEVNKQYFLSYLFRSTAYHIKKYPDLNSTSTPSEGLYELFLTQKIFDTFTSQSKVMPVEFQKFMKKYLPIIIRYITDASLNITSKEYKEDNIFSVNELIGTGSFHALINPSKIFDDEQPVSEKKTAEILEKKKGAIYLEVATPPEAVEDKNKSMPKTEAGDVENTVDKKTKTVDEKNNVHTSKRTKGDETEDFNESVGLKEKKEEMNDELVPNTPVKDLKHSNSVINNEILSKKKEVSVSERKPTTNDPQTVSSKRERTPVHDDL